MSYILCMTLCKLTHSHFSVHWNIHFLCKLTHSHVWHDGFICVAWLDVGNARHSCVRRMCFDMMNAYCHITECRQCDVSICDVCDVSICDVSICDVSICDVSICDVSICDVSVCDVSICDVSICDVSICDVSISWHLSCDMTHSYVSYYWM